MGGKRKQQGQGQSHGHSDQYGEFKSQDREEHFQFSKGSQTGGGSAGGASRTSTQVAFQRHVPKFLQPYAHMLGKSAHQKLEEEEEPAVLDQPQRAGGGAGEEEEEDDGDDHLVADAMQRALADNPELAAELGDQFSRKVEAEAEKARGNEAYGAKQWRKAATHFTKCIALDPTNEVYYSNRSAAHASGGDYAAAAEDAEVLVRLKPGWVKSWARLAAARYGLQQYSDARDAYERALRLEPDDHALQKGMEKAQLAELQQVKEHKHVFKKRKAGGGGGGGRGGGGGGGGGSGGGEGKGGQQQGGAGGSGGRDGGQRERGGVMTGGEEKGKGKKAGGVKGAGAGAAEGGKVKWVKVVKALLKAAPEGRLRVQAVARLACESAGVGHEGGVDEKVLRKLRGSGKFEVGKKYVKLSA